MIGRIKSLNPHKAIKFNAKRLHSCESNMKKVPFYPIQQTIGKKMTQHNIEPLKKMAVDLSLLPKKEKEDLEKYLLAVGELSLPPNKFNLNTKDTIYLCLYSKSSITNCEIGEYMCKEFQSIQDAENYYSALKKESNNNYDNNYYKDARNGIVVTVPVFVPQILHKMFIENQLSRLLVNVIIDQ